MIADLSSDKSYNKIYQIENFVNVHTAHKALVNFVIGVERALNDECNILGAFGIDFNYLNLEALNPYYDANPSHRLFNMYHLSGGTEWEREKFNLTLGLTCSMGCLNGSTQLINMNTPRSDNLFFGDINNTADSFFIRAKILIGCTYYFARI